MMSMTSVMFHRATGIDANVCIEAHDRSGLERRLRYCARPPFVGVESEPPHIAPARGPPLWNDCGDAMAGEGTQIGPP